MRVGWQLPLERLSATSLSLAATCAEQFRQRYLLKREDKLFGPRFIGIVDHDVNARLMTWLQELPGDQDFPQDIPGLYQTVWNEQLDKQGEPDWKEDDPLKAFSRGILMAETYWHEVGQHVKPVCAEQRVEFTVPGVPSKVVGYVDVMERDWIRERKTTAVKTTKPKPKWRFSGDDLLLRDGPACALGRDHSPGHPGRLHSREPP